MKPNSKYILPTLLLLFTCMQLNAQRMEEFDSSIRRPVLVDDIRINRLSSTTLEHTLGITTPLSAEQEETIKALNLDYRRKLLASRNQQAEKQARLNTLEAEENANLKAINKAIDELMEFKSNQRKLQAAWKQDIRMQLTPEQRVEFDAAKRKIKMRSRGGKHSFIPDFDMQEPQ